MTDDFFAPVLVTTEELQDIQLHSIISVAVFSRYCRVRGLVSACNVHCSNSRSSGLAQ